MYIHTYIHSYICTCMCMHLFTKILGIIYIFLNFLNIILKIHKYLCTLIAFLQPPYMSVILDSTWDLRPVSLYHAEWIVRTKLHKIKRTWTTDSACHSKTGRWHVLSHVCGQLCDKPFHSNRMTLTVYGWF